MSEAVEWAFAMSAMVTCVFVASSLWKREVSNGRTKANRAHVEDLENPSEVQSPGGDHLSIVLRAEESRNCIPFPPLDDFRLDLCHSTAIQGIVSK